MPVGRDEFSALVNRLDYPMYVVTTAARDGMAGCLVGFTSQVSIDPPLFLVCLSKENHTLELASLATHLAVHFLGPDNVDLAHLFGEQTGDEVDKFVRCDWSLGPHGMPILDRTPAFFVARIVERYDFGDHVGHLLEPEKVAKRRAIAGMLSYLDVRDLEPGHDA